MSDALTFRETERTEDVDLAANDRSAMLTKKFFPSYFGIFNRSPQHFPSVAQPAWTKLRVQRVVHFLSARGSVAVV
jgi:hypothetical protein